MDENCGFSLVEKDCLRLYCTTHLHVPRFLRFFFLCNNVDSCPESFYIGESDLEEFKRSMPDQAKQSELLSLTTNIVAAHVSNNSVAATELPMIIRDVYDTLSNVGSPRASEPERPSPAGPIQIGRASCRERGWQYVKISVVAD